MPASLRLALPSLLVLACQAATQSSAVGLRVPTLDALRLQPEPEPPAESVVPETIRVPPEPEQDDELLAQRSAIANELVRIDAEIEALEANTPALRTRERELRTSRPIDEPALQEVLAELDRTNERIAALRGEQAAHQRRAAEVEHAIQTRREDECRDCFDPDRHFQKNR